MFSTSKKQADLKEIFFRKKNGHMANMASQRAQKWAFFFLAAPKFTPRKSDRNGVRNTVVYNFHDIWAFGSPDLVKNGQKSAIRP